MPNKELIKNWVDALRSGKYKQGQKALRQETPEGSRFCCLGVACDLEDPKKWRNLEGGKADFDYHQGWLSQELLAKLGFNHMEQSSLANMNDNQGKTFDEIARYLEINYLNG